MSRHPVPPLSGLAVTLGLLTVAWPLPWTRAWAYATACLGVVAVLAAAISRWRRGPGLAVAAAIVSCALPGAGVAVLTAEGLLILGYLLAVDAPAGIAVPGRWLRRQAVLLVPALVATGTVLAAYAVRPSASAWLAPAGIAAAVTAYLVALPSPRRDTSPAAVLRSSTVTRPARQPLSTTAHRRSVQCSPAQGRVYLDDRHKVARGEWSTSKEVSGCCPNGRLGGPAGGAQFGGYLHQAE